MAVGVAMLMVPVMSTVPGLRAVLSLRAVPGLWTVPVMARLRVIRVGWVASVGLRA
ncbi:hypothetical protein ACIP79_22790 [Streptomyces sp. NPDC088747]|uniref:hypothetical protein n=1 Tax=Streptomyces sp. NPDC088747 TaxID=3365886 RepID=UPI0038221E7D